jgi:hypothetical protein
VAVGLGVGVSVGGRDVLVGRIVAVGVRVDVAVIVGEGGNVLVAVTDGRAKNEIGLHAVREIIITREKTFINL